MNPPGQPYNDHVQHPSLLMLMVCSLCAAAAGGLAWGIRGQYGHETGAMITGVLVGPVLMLLGYSQQSLRSSLRSVAALTVAIGLGGSMTYGQTIGLTQDAPLIGNNAAWAWGMLGLAIKGGLWIGLGATFLGMTLGDRTYSWQEIALTWLVMFGLFKLGCFVINEPFDPANKVLPWIYFSDDWYWEPEGQLKPRREVWGGYLFTLMGLLVWLRFLNDDRTAFRIGLCGALGGAIGFPAGQMIQSYNAWHPDGLQKLWLGDTSKLINWWNMMEITFGFIMAGVLAIGVMRNRPNNIEPTNKLGADTSTSDKLPLFSELPLLLIHLYVLWMAEFGSNRWISQLYDPGLILAWVPMILVFGGRFSDSALVSVVVLLPIAGKTIVRIQKESSSSFDSIAIGCVVGVGVLAVGLMALLEYLKRRSNSQRLGMTVLLSFSLLALNSFNWIFFDFPVPWQKWTARTPSAILFAVFTLILVAMLIVVQRRHQQEVTQRES